MGQPDKQPPDGRTQVSLLVRSVMQRNHDSSNNKPLNPNLPQRPLPRVRGAERGRHHRRGDNLRPFQKGPEKINLKQQNI